MSAQTDVPRPIAAVATPEANPGGARWIAPMGLRRRLADLVAVAGMVVRLARESTPKRSVVYVLRTLIRFGTAARWLRFLEAFRRRHRLGPVPVDLARRSLGTHLVHGEAARTALMRSCVHQLIATRVFDRGLLSALWQGCTIEIARVAGRRESWRVDLCRSELAGARHEGELTVSLGADHLAKPLCRLTFAFVRVDGRTTLAIGGLQGSGLADAKTAMIAATRDLGGLRPKDALLLTLEGLACWLGASEIHAVSDETHVINRRRGRRRALKVAEYDTYWRDRHGREGGPFGFVLPVRHTDFEGEPANRRERAKRDFFELGRSPR